MLVLNYYTHKPVQKLQVNSNTICLNKKHMGLHKFVKALVVLKLV